MRDSAVRSSMRIMTHFQAWVCVTRARTQLAVHVSALAMQVLRNERLRVRFTRWLGSCPRLKCLWQRIACLQGSNYPELASGGYQHKYHQELAASWFDHRYCLSAQDTEFCRQDNVNNVTIHERDCNWLPCSQSRSVRQNAKPVKASADRYGISLANAKDVNGSGALSLSDRLMNAGADIQGRDVHVSVISLDTGPYLRIPRNALVPSNLKRHRGPQLHRLPPATLAQRNLAADVLTKACVHMQLAVYRQCFPKSPTVCD